jgi:hypothetical protein
VEADLVGDEPEPLAGDGPHIDLPHVALPAQGEELRDVRPHRVVQREAQGAAVAEPDRPSVTGEPAPVAQHRRGPAAFQSLAEGVQAERPDQVGVVPSQRLELLRLVGV